MFSIVRKSKFTPIVKNLNRAISKTITFFNYLAPKRIVL
jgi:hypothetical protein